MKKSLYELSLEYEQSEEIVGECIKKTLLERRKAKLRGCTDAVMALTNKLNILYDEKRELKINGDKLRTYYDRKEETDSSHQLLLTGTGG